MVALSTGTKAYTGAAPYYRPLHPHPQPWRRLPKVGLFQPQPPAMPLRDGVGGLGGFVFDQKDTHSATANLIASCALWASAGG